MTPSHRLRLCVYIICVLFAHTGVLYHTPFCFAIGIFEFYNLFTILFSLPFPAHEAIRQLGGGELD